MPNSILLHDKGSFHDWVNAGCPADPAGDGQAIIDALWNTQAGIQRQCWKTRKTKAGTVVSFDHPEADQMVNEAARALTRAFGAPTVVEG